MEDRLVPDETFLSALLPYPRERLPRELPLRSAEFLSRVGLPPRVRPFREPRHRLTKAEIFFSPEQVALRRLDSGRYFSVGTIWDSRFLVDLTSERVFYENQEGLLFVNSSLEHFAVSMAYWLDFYPKFAKRVNAAASSWPQGNVLHYIAERPELYRPGLTRLTAIDPRALEEQGYWSALCDLSRF